MKRFALVLVAGLIPFVAANAQDSAREKIEEILKKIERAGGKSKDKVDAAKAAAEKDKDADYVPNVPGPKEPKDGTLVFAKLQGVGVGAHIEGRVAFRQKGAKVLLGTEFKGLPDGEYGFHIHARGDCSAPDFSSAGGHFNPQGKKHGSRDSEHHAGDLGNLKIKGGRRSEFPPLDGFSLSVGKTGIIGRSVIIHEKPDDYTTQPTGNAGARIACGVISAEQ